MWYTTEFKRIEITNDNLFTGTYFFFIGGAVVGGGYTKKRNRKSKNSIQSYLCIKSHHPFDTNIYYNL